MKRILVTAAILLAASPVMAATYSWTDDSGTFNFTDDYSQVPRKYRNRINLRDTDTVEPAVAAKAVVPDKAKTAPVKEPAEAVAPKAADEDKVYGGKSLYLWRSQLAEAQARLSVLDAKVKSASEQLNHPGDVTEKTSINGLRQRYNDAVSEFNQASAGFDGLLEAARKAGVPL